MKGKSCLSQLLHVFDDWARERNKGKTTDVIFLDLSKAFDSVPHVRLITKIKAYGIQGPLLSWLNSFLINRNQRVIVRGTYSKWTKVTSGVPQGTVLGPIMFLIYINDISNELESPIKLFADDIKVYRVLNNVEEDHRTLQNDLMKLETWSANWQLNFNTEKCEVMRITKKTDHTRPSYTLTNKALNVVDETKDLGVNITSKLSWSLHVNQCVNKANRVLGFLKRTVGPKNHQLFSKLYKTLVRPILEYCSPVWSPYLKKDIKALEKVQRRASRCALRNKGGHDISYEERLKILQWPTLEKRRDYLSLVECYKTIHSLNGLDPSMYFTFASNFRQLRSNHCYKLKSVMAKLNSYKYSFFVRVIPIWNSLPEYVAEAESLMAFKERLRIHLMD